MTVVAVAGVKGAPGVSTLVLALACTWPATRGVTVVEADPHGGVLAARRMLAPEPGLVTLAAALRRGATALAAHTQTIGADAHAVAAPASAEQTRAALVIACERLPHVLGAHDGDVVIDCGRLTTDSPTLPLARHATVTLLLVRPRADDVVAVRDRVQTLRRTGVDPHLLLADDGPYSAPEVAAAVDAPVIAQIPRDRRAAHALEHQTGAAMSARSALLRTARHIVGQVVAPSDALASRR